MNLYFQNQGVIRLIRSALALLWILIVGGCAIQNSIQHHPILGSNFGYPNYKLTLQTDTERATFRIKLFTLNYDECASGNIDYIEFDGAINKDSIEVFQTVLLEAQGCKNKQGIALYPFVYLNSSVGDFKDGYVLGELFRKHNIQTIVTQGQICRGACAVAFLGGKGKAVKETGSVVFAASKGKGFGIDCERANEQVTLRAYIQKMLNPVAADRFYFNLLNYCNQTDGWTLSAETTPIWIK